VKFLFWNLNNRPLRRLIAELAHDHAIDVLMLSECSISPISMLGALNTGRAPRYSKPFSLSKFVTIYIRLPEGSLRLIEDAGRLSIRELCPPIGESILLAVAHLPSKLYQRDDDQALDATRIARDIDRAEQKVGHDRTIVVGDLNMNPFETGVVGAEGLHAIMDRRIVERGHRIVGGRSRRYLYNPMWGRMGDCSPGPPGTYFYNSARQTNYFWNTFDQVLIRSSLLDRFKNEDLEVITAIGTANLLSDSGAPDPSVGSDHLPVMFSLDLERSMRNGNEKSLGRP